MFFSLDHTHGEVLKIILTIKYTFKVPFSEEKLQKFSGEELS